MSDLDAPHVQPRQVGITQGWRWIAAGFGLFGKNPLIWIVFLMTYLAMQLVLAVFVPVIGMVVAAMLDPVLIAGFMAGARALELEEELEIGHLFTGFRTHFKQLAAVGGFYLSGKIALILLATGLATLVYGPLPELDMTKMDAADPALLPVIQQYMMVGILIMVTLVPLLMAYWFAPALVLFDGMPALEAMKLSFTACLKNVLPFTLYGAVSLILFVLGSIPFALGLLAVIPVLFATSIYAAYRDIFVVA